MKRILTAVVFSTLLMSLGLPGLSAPAGAAIATVGNGLTTTDLNAVGMSPASIAASLVGPGVAVSNATFSGNNVQGGLIHVVDPAVVSFNDGVVLSSGNIADVVGPNKSESTTTDVNGPGDPTLDALIQNTQTVVPATYDAASLQFDFVPTGNHVYFTYTFGSDEYLEWVNLYNDVFGFFVNGQNCAVTPSNQPVSIDTINSAVNPNLYRDNGFASPPANPINIEPDGLTVEMICSAPVNAGQVNHMKLAIADTSDHILDSVVMIKAQSLSVLPPESCNNGTDDNGDGKIDMNDPLCQASTTPPPTGNGGIGSGNTAPPFTGNEGTPIPLDASAFGWTTTPDTVSTTWQVTGINGTPGSCGVTPSAPQPPNFDGSIAVVQATCPNEGEYVAHVWGWDGPGGTGGSTFDYDVDFFVHNAPPAVTINAPTSGSSVPIGQTVAVSASVTDLGVNDTATCKIDWGDGTSAPGTMNTGTCSASHAYSAVGPAIVAVTATDNANSTGAAAATLTVVAAAPACGASCITVGDTAMLETDAGTHSLLVPVTLSQPATQPVTVQYTVTAGTATGGTKAAAGVDYKVKTGTLTWKPNLKSGLTPISKAIAVPIFGDTTVEGDETFTVTLSNPTGGFTTGPGTGTGDCGAIPGCATGTIVNDDGVASGLTLGIGDASIFSARSGAQAIKLPVTLSSKALTPVTVNVTVTPGTATFSRKAADGGDYGGTVSRTVTFRPGATLAQIALPIWPDALAEPDQAFTVTLSNVNGNGTGVTVIRTTGAGLIKGLT